MKRAQNPSPALEFRKLRSMAQLKDWVTSMLGQGHSLESLVTRAKQGGDLRAASYIEDAGREVLAGDSVAGSHRTGASRSTRRYPVVVPGRRTPRRASASRPDRQIHNLEVCQRARSARNWIRKVRMKRALPPATNSGVPEPSPLKRWRS